MGAGASYDGSRPGTATSQHPTYVHVAPQQGGVGATQQLHARHEGPGVQTVTFNQQGTVSLGKKSGHEDGRAKDTIYPSLAEANNTTDHDGGGAAQQPPTGNTLRPTSTTPRPRSPFEAAAAEAAAGETRPRSPMYPPTQQHYRSETVSSFHAMPGGGGGQPPPIGFKSEFTNENQRAGSAQRGGRVSASRAGRTMPDEPRALVGIDGHRSHKTRPGQLDAQRRPENNDQQWDEKRDLVYMRVLSADEFLGRMWETDENVKNWSQCEEPQLKFKRLRELLGLRGHLQDELLRIEAMLAEDDPELKCLTQFQGNFPHVVEKLREINEKNKRIHIREEDINVHNIVAASSSTATASKVEQRATQHSRQGHTSSMATQSGHGGKNMATQSDNSVHNANLSTEDDIEPTEEDLKQKHDLEENDVSEKFANQFVKGGDQMTQDDVNSLLDQHALRMQELRKKQKMEKSKFAELLEQRKQERLLTRRAAKNEAEDMEAEKQRKKQQEKPLPAASSFYVDLNDKGKKKGKGKKSKQDTIMEEDAKPKAKELDPNDYGPQSGWFYVDMDEKSKGKGADSKDDGQKPIGKVSMATQAANNEKTDSGKDDEERAQDEAELENNEYDDDFEDDSGPDTEDLRSTLKEDLWTTLKTKTGNHDTFKELLDKFRGEQAERRHIMESENSRNKTSLLSKMAARKKLRENGDVSGVETPTQTDTASVASFSMGTDEDELVQQELKDMKDVRSKDNEFLQKIHKQRNSGQISDEEFQRLLKKHLDDTEALRLSRNAERDRLRDKLQEKIKKRNEKKGSDISEEIDIHSEINEKVEKELTILEENFQKDLLKQKKDISAEELQALLDKYRRDQEALLQAKHDDKARSNEKLQQKLEARRRNREEKNKAKEVKSTKKLNKMDDEFFQDILQLQGHDDMTEDAFADMLQSYLDRMHSVERDNKRQKRKNEKANVMGRVQQEASQVVTEHEQHTKQITDIRQREKEINDQKLRKKLQSKKNKNTIKEEDKGFFEAEEENV